MRKSLVLLILLALLPAARARAQEAGAGRAGGTQAPANQEEQAEATRLNAEVQRLFREGKYDEALPLAKRVLELRERASGGDEMLLAYALFNLASVYTLKGKDGDAEPLFRRVLAIAEKHGDETDFGADTNGQLGRLRLNARDYKGAAPFLQRALDIRQKLHGAEGEEVVPPLLNLADLYFFRNEPQQANALLARAVSILNGLSPKKDAARAQRLRGYLCLLMGLSPAKDEKLASQVGRAAWRLEEPEEAAEYERDVKERMEKEARGESEVVGGVVLNGRAISKPQPAYPSEAKHRGIMGAVVVKILVDGTGRVVKAEPVCGHPILGKAAADAARAARFTPTLLSGKPVEVSGLITYNFVLQ